MSGELCDRPILSTYRVRAPAAAAAAKTANVTDQEESLSGPIGRGFSAHPSDVSLYLLLAPLSAPAVIALLLYPQIHNWHRTDTGAEEGRGSLSWGTQW